MKIFQYICISILAVFASLPTYAEEQVNSDNLRYYIIEATPKPEVFRMLMEKPIDPSIRAAQFLQNMQGAKLLGYYLKVDSPVSISVIAVPDSFDIASLVYQRKATGLIEDIEIYEVMLGDRFKNVLEAANELESHNKYKKKK